ncbi:MAG TPA: response regulator [Myxococcota bacterium]
MNGGNRLSKVLVVGDSAALRDVLRLAFSEHADRVLTASSIGEAEHRIAEHCDIEVVVSDLELPDADGFRLLSLLAALEEPKPRVNLLTAQASEAESSRAYQMGAIGVLSKPIALRDIAAVLKQQSGHWNGARAPRRRSDGRACVVDRAREAAASGGRPQLFWYMRDVGETGAFLETESPIPVGTKLDLALDVDTSTVHVTAKVVRVQEPSWGASGGVGVQFVDYGIDARTQLTRYVASPA